MVNSSEIFLRVAEAIGSQICKHAFWSGSRCNWIGRSLDDMPAITNAPYSISNRALSSEIYDGTSGIAIFLSNLYHYNSNEKCRLTADGAINQALSCIDDIPYVSRFGFYSGRIGIVYVATKLGRIFDNDALIEKATEELQRVSVDIKTEHLMDVISGNAGAIPSLLEIYENLNEERVLELAIQLGSELISTAVKEPFGWSWDFRANGVQTTSNNLTGFAHGAAGIGYALLELFDKTQKKEFLEAAEHAFEYENHWFNKQNNNWPDFRVDNKNDDGNFQGFAYSAGWCHGAPGIGLSRLRAYQILNDEKYTQDVHAALRTAERIVKEMDANTANFSLCHGLAGIGELLLYATEIFNDSFYKSLATEIGRFGIEKYASPGLPWPCGIQTGITPGLMLGLAGIGNFYLRLCDINRISSPLIIVRK
jgi:type 2 lantibiotic biosynthesis protein LanM